MSTLGDLLLREHALIRRAAACLDLLSAEVIGGGRLRVGVAADLLAFFEEFGDGIHQTKEERLLFPELVRVGLAVERVRHLVEDHRESREHLQTMRRHLEVAAFGNPVSCQEFARAAQAYAAAERGHADEEDRVLLPLVEELLDPAARERVLQGFEDLERRLSARPFEELRDLVARALESLVEAEDSATGPC